MSGLATAAEPVPEPTVPQGVVQLVITQGTQRVTGTATVVHKGVLMASINCLPLHFFLDVPAAGVVVATVGEKAIPLRIAGVQQRWSLMALVPIDVRDQLPNPLTLRPPAKGKPDLPLAPGTVLRYASLSSLVQTTLIGTYMEGTIPSHLQLQANPAKSLGCPVLATDDTLLGIITSNSDLRANTAPPAAISEILNGTVTSFRRENFTDPQGNRRSQVEVAVADPLQRISDLRVELTPSEGPRGERKLPNIILALKRLAGGTWSAGELPATRFKNGQNVTYGVKVLWKSANGSGQMDEGAALWRPEKTTCVLAPLPFPLGLIAGPALTPLPPAPGIPALLVGSDGVAKATLVSMPNSFPNLVSLTSAPDGSALYCVDTTRNLILVLDPVDVSIRSEWPVPRVPSGVAWVNGHVVVSCTGSNRIVFLDPTDGHVQASMSVPSNTVADEPGDILGPDGPDGVLVEWTSGIWRHRPDGSTLKLDWQSRPRWAFPLKNGTVMWYTHSELEVPIPRPGGEDPRTDEAARTTALQDLRTAWPLGLSKSFKKTSNTTFDRTLIRPDGKALLVSLTGISQTQSYTPGTPASQPIPGQILAVDACRNEALTVDKVSVKNHHLWTFRLARLPELSVTRTITVETPEADDHLRTATRCYVPGHRLVYFYSSSEGVSTIFRLALGP